jgi:hypothetical protein
MLGGDERGGRRCGCFVLLVCLRRSAPAGLQTGALPGGGGGDTGWLGAQGARMPPAPAPCRAAALSEWPGGQLPGRGAGRQATAQGGPSVRAAPQV